MNNELLHTALLKQIYLVTKESRWKRFSKNPFKPFYRRMLESISKNLHLLMPVNVNTFWGERIQIILPEKSSCYILKFGFWEEDVALMLIKHLKPGNIFFDVGAHMGYFSLLAHKLVGEQGHIHCFEPSHWAFNILQKNTKHITNCTLNPVAVFSEEKELSFNDYGPINSLYNSFFSINSSEPISRQLKKQKYTVKTISLDNYCQKNNIIPDVVKIDAESAEHHILKGMEHIINMKKTIFVFETGGYVRDNTNSDNEAASLLLKKGYTPFECKNNALVNYDLKKEDHYKNILFMP